MKFTTWSYRFAEEILNGKLAVKREIEDTIRSVNISKDHLTRPALNEAFRKEFEAKGWETEVRLFNEPEEPLAKIDYLKERVGVEVSFAHSSFIGIDLLKLQTLRNLPSGSISFEKVRRYLPHFRSAVQVPIWVVGLEG